MKYGIKPCDDRAQDSWSDFYLALARPLVERYGVQGKGAVREGVRQYAAALGEKRREQLRRTGNKTNLETVFSDGFGLPCGTRARKEWIEASEQQLFVNVVRCPLADRWMAQDGRELGHMYCEEFYPALVHAAASEKAQINLGNTLMNGRDDFCRLSVYLRPANLPPEKRAECFPAFDVTGAQPAAEPLYTPDFALQMQMLFRSFVSSAREKLGEDGALLVREAARAYNEGAEQTEIHV